MSQAVSQQQIPFANRLQKVWKHYSKLARRQGVACFRFYDHDLPQFPFAIEWYDGAVHAAEYQRRHGMEDEAHDAWLQECKSTIAEVLQVPLESVFMKERKRKAGRQDQYEKFGEDKVERIVPESDLHFIINLTDYLDTGLFLDHRITREMVRKEIEGKRFLNLFCYTGAFSVHAAKGGAEQVVSVDMSKTYLNWAKRNMQFNKLYKDQQHHFLHEDVLAWIQDLPADSFDVIVCDPPTFSNSKRMEGTWDVQRDHVALLRKLIRALSPDGVLYFSNNYKGFVLDRDSLPTDRIEDITRATTPFDFEGRLHRACFRIQP
jgi:23S rRNA (cytosine1962-C5)-methyltransferase